jgi:site-specific DNA-methyltransferase (adenine-specific)
MEKREPISQVTNEDCMELMSRYPDKYFELAIVDPPYGIGISKNPFRQKHSKKIWDDAIPKENYFTELFRVSKNQIIWGGNYFNLEPTQCFIIWDKIQPENFSSAMCEMAWTNFEKPAKIIRKRVVNSEANKIHPTQKPVKLYEWILKNYASEGDKILDTHLGSGSSRIAADKMGFDFYACELDSDYFEAQEKRFKEYKSQLILF